jgi:hypothetical protein
MTPDEQAPYVRRAALASAAGVAALGLLVLLAWHVGSVSVIRATLASGPMQYNTALSFLLAGASLWVGLQRRPRLAAGLAIALAALAGATLAQYRVGDLGIDELVVRDYVQQGANHPGRMATNTAVCFLAAAFALVLASGVPRADHKGLLLALCGSFVSGVALVALAGYAVGVSTAYAWNGLASMALHTATGFLALGVGLVLVGWDFSATGDGATPRWLPVPVSAIVVTASLFLWQALVSHCGRRWFPSSMTLCSGARMPRLLR